MEGSASPTFYQLLQLSPQALWPAIHDASGRERGCLVAAMAVRSVLLVAFAVLFIAGLTPVFGAENSSLVVGGFCMLLGIRFVPFGYRARDSVAALAVALALTVAGGMVASLGMPVLSFACNLLFLWTVLVLVAQDPPMGNAGTYVFAYVFVSQSPVAGRALALRWALAALLLVLCGAVLLHRHRHEDADVPLRDVLARLSLADPRTRWRLRMAAGVAAVLLVGDLLAVPRSVWMGYACMSVLLPYGPQAQGARAALRRGVERGAGVVVGSALYWALSAVAPPSAHGAFGPAAGVCMGFSSRYFWNNVLNCFGALLLASAVFGTAGSAVLRVEENLAGIAFALACATLWSWVERRHPAGEAAA